MLENARLLSNPNTVNLHGKAGYTPLHMLASVSSIEGELTRDFDAIDVHTIEFLHFLLAAGANPNARTDNGDTPLHLAMQDGKRSFVFWMISRYGADPTLKNDKGQTPIDIALSRRSVGYCDCSGVIKVLTMGR